MSDILVNGMITPDGTKMYSMNRHDYNTYTDANGEQYMVDGGLDYLRRSVNKEPAMDVSVYLDDNWEWARHEVTWGTYGKEGDQPLRYVDIASMSTEHINAILDSTSGIYPQIVECFKKELKYREAYSE